MKQPNKKKIKKAIVSAASKAARSQVRSQSKSRADIPVGFAKQHVPRKWSVSGTISLDGNRSKKRQLKKIKKWQSEK